MEPTKAFFYVPLRQNALGQGVLLRTAMRPEALAAALTREVHALDPNLAPSEVISMREQVARTTSAQTMAVRLLTVFGALAVLLAGIGSYGVMSAAVSQSSREFGLRLALGATAADLLRLVLSRGLALSAAGVMLGAAAAIQLTRLLGDMLFKVSPRDPLSFAIAFLVMAIASSAACFVPAWRATRTVSNAGTPRVAPPMSRIGLLVVLGALIVAPLTAQAPASWRLRADNSTNASDPDAAGDITFVASDPAFMQRTRAQRFSGVRKMLLVVRYSLKGTFTLLEPSNHTNYYGLVFGGSDLAGPAQQYVYFLVAQDGTWLVKRRDGDAKTDSILPKTASTAVRRPDASGRSVNVIEVRVTPAAMEFVVNDTVVSRWSGAARIVKTDGVYGIRVNHFLNLQIDGLIAAPLARTTERSSLAQYPSKAETVALSGTVARIVSPTAFAVKDAGGAGDQEQLVTAPTLQALIDPNAPVTVFGTVGPTESAAKGSSTIRATTVLSAAMVDLTKPLPPPITADDERLDGLMKGIAPAFASLRQAVDGANAVAAKQQAETLADVFADVEAFWTAKSRADATAWAKTAHTSATAIAREAAAANLESVKSATTTLGQQCQACHGTYREQFANGEFRIKMRR